MSISPTGQRFYPEVEQIPSANMETTQAITSEVPKAQKVNEDARLVALQNRFMGGTHPLMREAGNLLGAFSARPEGTYYKFGKGEEFYNPQLGIGELISIGLMFRGKVYTGAAGTVTVSHREMQYTEMDLWLYRDQAEEEYEKLLQKYPHHMKEPFGDNEKPKYSAFANFFRSSTAIEEELKQRKQEQLRIIQKVSDYLMGLGNPGIERIYIPTREERIDKFHTPIEYAAITDAIYIVHRKVPPEEQKGREFYEQQNKALQEAMYLAEEERLDRERLLENGPGSVEKPIDPNDPEEWRIATLEPTIDGTSDGVSADTNPTVAAAEPILSRTKEARSAMPLPAVGGSSSSIVREVPEAPQPHQAVPPTETVPNGQSPKGSESFFLQIWDLFKRCLSWIFCFRPKQGDRPGS